MSSIHSSSSSHYGGLNTASPPPSKTSALGGNNNHTNDEEEWLQVPGSTSKKKTKKNFQSLEMGHDDDDDDDENNSIISGDSIDSMNNNDSDSHSQGDDDDDDEEYELTDQYTPTITDHITGRTTLLRCMTCSNNYHWRPKERVRCIILLLGICLVLTVIYAKYPDNISGLLRSSNHGPPPGALGVGHASYDTVHSSYLEEYNARLTLYRHRSTGAEYLAFVPDNNGIGSGGGDESSGYDPKPDKVFGIAFRTKPESSTGVPHILEREFISIDY